MRFEIRRRASQEQPYFWRIVSDNGEPLATSEPYVTKASAQSALELVQAKAGVSQVLDRT
jgi:uncharacterized protein YegP (UPF0339 family)